MSHVSSLNAGALLSFSAGEVCGVHVEEFEAPLDTCMRWGENEKVLFS